MIDDGLIEMALHATVGHSDRPNPYRLASWLTEMQLLPLFAAPFAMDDIRTYLGSHERTEQQTTIQQWRAEDQRVLLARVGKKGQKHMATKAPAASVSEKPVTRAEFDTRMSKAEQRISDLETAVAAFNDAVTRRFDALDTHLQAMEDRIMTRLDTFTATNNARIAGIAPTSHSRKAKE